MTQAKDRPEFHPTTGERIYRATLARGPSGIAIPVGWRLIEVERFETGQTLLCYVREWR